MAPMHHHLDAGHGFDARHQDEAVVSPAFYMKVEEPVHAELEKRRLCSAAGFTTDARWADAPCGKPPGSPSTAYASVSTMMPQQLFRSTSLDADEVACDIQHIAGERSRCRETRTSWRNIEL